MRGTRFAAGIAALVAAVSLGGMATVASAAPRAPLGTSSSRSDVREIAPGKQYSTSKLGNVRQSSARARAARALAAAPTPPVGTVRQWLGSTTPRGILYRKDYTLRGVGDKIEVWVANDTAFPAGDCRAQIPNSTTITDAQVAAPDHRVRRQHVPEGDGDVQHAA